jgi:hypothetical protein
VKSFSDVEKIVGTVRVATGAGLGNDVANEVARILAVHQFTSEFGADALSFVNAQL